MPIQRRLDLAGHPALHPIAADQQHEGAARSQCLLQPLQPAVARLQVGRVLKHANTRLLEPITKFIGRRLVSVAVAEESQG